MLFRSASNTGEPARYKKTTYDAAGNATNNIPETAGTINSIKAEFDTYYELPSLLASKNDITETEARLLLSLNDEHFIEIANNNSEKIRAYAENNPDSEIAIELKNRVMKLCINATNTES